MSNTEALVATFETITPVFCAGADQNGPAEIRPFSLRGALRWFYRALDFEFRSHEGSFFGSTSGNKVQASPITLSVLGPEEGWGSRLYNQDLPPKEAMQRGECYLGYTFYLGANKRQAVPPQKRFKVILSFTWEKPQQKVLEAWVASLWLFSTLGGLGSRARRGFGTCALVDLEADECWPSIPVIKAQNPKEWHEAFKKGFAQIRQWFPYNWQSGHFQHQVLPKEVKTLIFREGFPTWKEALRDIGNRFREFRHRHRTKKNLLASFGLPLASRSMGDTLIPVCSDSRQGVSERSASRLWIRVLKLGEQYYPMVWHSEGPLVPPGTSLKWKKTQDQERLASGLGLITDFLNELQQAGYM